MTHNKQTTAIMTCRITYPSTAILLSLFFAFQLNSVALNAQSVFADQIIADLKQASGEKSQFQVQAKLLSRKANSEDLRTEMLIYVDRENGVQRSLAKLLAPERSKGQIFLNNAASYWAYYPKLQRSLALSPLATLAGDVSIGDILAPPAMQIYKHKVLKSEGQELVLEFVKTSRNAPYTRVLQFYVGDNLKNAEFYGGHDGKILMKRTQYAKRLKLNNGFYFYSQVKIINELQKGSVSIIAFSTPQELELPKNWFNPNNLQQVP